MKQLTSLIGDTIPQEEVFFLNVDKNKYTIYIHFKHNVLLKYFEVNAGGIRSFDISHGITETIVLLQNGKNTLEAARPLRS